MRIVTRPDFDGIVCAALIRAAQAQDMDIYWIEPNELQSGNPDILKGDIIANLPWHPNAALWFDHHVSNRRDTPVPGAFDIAPSAAGLVYTYYQSRSMLDTRFDELVAQTDIIDSADLTMDQVRTPENYPYILLSMTIQNKGYTDIPYWNRLVEMLRLKDIHNTMADPEVARRCREVVRENREFSRHLMDHTRLVDRISVTDFRSFTTPPPGNRFLTYSLFPDSIASVKIRYADPDRAKVLISVGHSIFNKTCRINVGKMLARFGGGGHAGAGGCTLDGQDAQEKIDQILAILRANTGENPA